MRLRHVFHLTLIATSVMLAAWPAAVSRSQSVIVPKGQRVVREPIEWIRLWLPNVNKSALPRALLVGDSITEAYYRDVAAGLKGKAYVGYLASSLSVGDPMLSKLIALTLKNYRFDVIHFNNGMHGRGYSEKEYARYFSEYLRTIEANAHGAKLIWATTTPVRMGKSMADLAPWTRRIIARNKTADAYIRRAHIPIDDLYALVLHHTEYYVGGDGTHPNAAGRAAEARSVEHAVLAALRK